MYIYVLEIFLSVVFLHAFISDKLGIMASEWNLVNICEWNMVRFCILICEFLHFVVMALRVHVVYMLWVADRKSVV